MIPLKDALEAYARTLRALPAETLAIGEAAHRVLAEPLSALNDLPRFDQSAMDGYALHASDIEAASAAWPRRLPVAQRIAAGAHGTLARLEPGSAARILTGAPLPPGADTVIPQERVHREGDALAFAEAYPRGRNIRRRGEELQAGTAIARQGQRITPGLLASLISAGITQVRVHRRPRVRVVVTGDELRPAGTTLAPGQIPDGNGPMLRALLARQGLSAPPSPAVEDREEAVAAALAQALEEADLVLTSGGASVGDRDFVVAVAERLGVERVFWKVAQKPGKPMFFGVRERGGRQAALIALPGNPGAVLIGMHLHAQRALDLLEGIAEPAPHWAAGVLDIPIDTDDRRIRLVRMEMRHDAHGLARLQALPHQDSHMMSNLSSADVLVWVPPGESDLPAGTILRWTALSGA